MNPSHPTCHTTPTRFRNGIAGYCRLLRTRQCTFRSPSYAILLLNNTAEIEKWAPSDKPSASHQSTKGRSPIVGPIDPPCLPSVAHDAQAWRHGRELRAISDPYWFRTFGVSSPSLRDTDSSTKTGLTRGRHPPRVVEKTATSSDAMAPEGLLILCQPTVRVSGSGSASLCSAVAYTLCPSVLVSVRPKTKQRETKESQSMRMPPQTIS